MENTDVIITIGMDHLEVVITTLVTCFLFLIIRKLAKLPIHEWILESRGLKQINIDTTDGFDYYTVSCRIPLYVSEESFRAFIKEEETRNEREVLESFNIKMHKKK